MYYEYIYINCSIIFDSNVQLLRMQVNIFNMDTIKLSYSCMPNMGNIIKQHNTKILQPSTANASIPCNCGTSVVCPLDGFVIQ